MRLLLACFVIAAVSALPIGNDVLDKANSVDSSPNDVAASVIKLEEIADVQLSDASGPSVATSTPVGHTTSLTEEIPFNPQHASSMFARLIDDIFQIPITVLQSVAKLITNPFKQQANATPEASSTY